MNENEKKLIGSLRKLPESSEANYPDASESWLRNLETIKLEVEKEEISNFLRWGCIKSTMFVGNAPYIDIEFLSILEHKDWLTRWEKAIQESAIGNPVPYKFYPKSSGNLIHNIYHVLNFEQYSGININKEIELIVEFGGGYGCMKRAICQAGYTGHYVLFDFPHLSALQKYYLQATGMADRTHFVSTEKELEDVLYKQASKKGMFIGTWSISETRLEYREKIFDILKNFKAYLIAYQNMFDGVDNDEYFFEYGEEHTKYNWINLPMLHLGVNKYIFGTRKD